MPDSGMLALSLLSLLIGSALVLSPKALLSLSRRLNTTLLTLDEWLIRHRYVMALVAFAACYAFFKLALLLPNATVDVSIHPL